MFIAISGSWGESEEERLHLLRIGRNLIALGEESFKGKVRGYNTLSFTGLGLLDKEKL